MVEARIAPTEVLSKAQQLSKEFHASYGSRGRFEPLFKDGGAERGGWVHRPWEVLNSKHPEEIEQEVNLLKEQGIKILGFVGMGGESTVIGSSDETIINLNSTAPEKFERFLKDRDISTMHWFVISKSGKTTETLTNGERLQTLYQDHHLESRDYVTYVTDPGTPMEKEKRADGYSVKYRELNGQTTVGGRNALVNYPTLLSYAWRNPGNLRSMLSVLAKEHGIENRYDDWWIKAGIEASIAIKNGRSKLAILQPESIRKQQSVWEQHTLEESLGKRKEAGFSVYTTRPDLETLRKNKDIDWVFLEFRVEGHEQETEGYVRIASQDGHPVITVPIAEGDSAFASQVAAYGIMKLVAVMGATWDKSGINFSDQDPVEKYKALMRERRLKLDDAVKPAGDAIARDQEFTLIFDGLLPFLSNDNLYEIKRLQSSNASPKIIYSKLLQATRSILTAQTLAYYGDADDNAENMLDHITQECLHKKQGYAAKWGEGTGVMHGLFVNWFSGFLHQIPLQIVACEHEDTEPSYKKGAELLIEGAVASHRALVEAKRPSLMLIVNGKLDAQGKQHLREFFE